MTMYTAHGLHIINVTVRVYSKTKMFKTSINWLIIPIFFRHICLQNFNNLIIFSL